MMTFNKSMFYINLIWVILATLFLLAFDYVCYGDLARFADLRTGLILAPIFIVIGAFSNQYKSKFNRIGSFILIMVDLVLIIGIFFMQLQKLNLSVMSWRWLVFILLSISFVVSTIIMLILQTKAQNIN